MNFASKVGLWTKRHSPELLIAGSIISMVGSVVLASVATAKFKKVISPNKDRIKRIREDIKIENIHEPDENKIKQLKKDMTVEYGKMITKVGALYLPAVLTCGLSISCMLGSHHIMKTRNIALASAYTILDNGFRAYRERVKAKLGEEAEEKIFKNVTKEKVTYVDEKGKEKTKTIEVEHHERDEDFVVLFDEPCYNYSRDASDNFTHLMRMQDHFNNRLKRRGWLTLDEIYRELGFTTEMLGARKATASKYLGWVYEPMNPHRDNFVSFGLTYAGTRQALPRVNEQISLNIPAFWLTFNPDGDILSDKIDGKENPNYFVKFAKDDGE